MKILFIILISILTLFNPYNLNSDFLSKPVSSSVKQTEKVNYNPPFEGYKLIEVDGGDLSGTRKESVVVDIGFGDRVYYAFTNKNGQLIRVIAKTITLQNEKKERLNKDGRYYDDEAAVHGTEEKNYDQGHVIADSLGGVANAYNITPQNSTLNRHGTQAYLEDQIRKAGGCTDFEAIITYPDAKTQTPSKYKFTYTIKGTKVVDEFENLDPDEVNKKLKDAKNNTATKPQATNKPAVTNDKKK